MSQQRYAALLRDLARCGVYHAPPKGMPDLLAAADKSGFAIFCIDLSAVRDKRALFERLPCRGLVTWCGFSIPFLGGVLHSIFRF